MAVFKSHSPLETKKIAATIAANITHIPNKKRGALVIALPGDLGAGKTTFTQGFAKALGISRRITSPTFVIMKRHIVKKSGYANLYHIDAYRMKSITDMEPLEFEAILKEPSNIVLIEWAENIKGNLLRGARAISLTHGTHETERTITVRGL